MNRILITITIAMLLVSTVTQAQVFWQGTVYGDSEAQVRAKVPNASPARQSDTLKRAGIGSMSDTSTVLADKAFDVFFYFSLDGKLDHVLLVQSNLKSSEEAKVISGALIDALRVKYGKVTKTENALRSAMEQRPMWFQWQSGDTDVLLVPQHGDKNLMVGYTLSDRAKARTDAKAAKDYSKRVDPKVEAGKL